MKILVQKKALVKLNTIDQSQKVSLVSLDLTGLVSSNGIWIEVNGLLKRLEGISVLVREDSGKAYLTSNADDNKWITACYE